MYARNAATFSLHFNITKRDLALPPFSNSHSWFFLPFDIHLDNTYCSFALPLYEIAQLSSLLRRRHSVYVLRHALDPAALLRFNRQSSAKALRSMDFSNHRAKRKFDKPRSEYLPEIASPLRNQTN
jgi:hypothetical protein